MHPQAASEAHISSPSLPLSPTVASGDVKSASDGNRHRAQLSAKPTAMTRAESPERMGADCTAEMPKSSFAYGRTRRLDKLVVTMGFKRYNELAEALITHAATLDGVELAEGGAHQPGYNALSLKHGNRRLSFECDGDAMATVLVFQDDKQARIYNLSSDAEVFAKQIEQSKTLVTTWHGGTSIAWEDEDTQASPPRSR